MNRATGAMITTSVGIASPVTDRKTSSDCPLSVSRLNCFRACVSQITAVNVNSAARNATAEIFRM